METLCTVRIVLRSKERNQITSYKLPSLILVIKWFIKEDKITDYYVNLVYVKLNFIDNKRLEQRKLLWFVFAFTL